MRKLTAEFPNKTWILSDYSYTYGKSRLQTRWRGGKAERQSVRWA